MFIPDPNFFHPGSQIKNFYIPDPGSAAKKFRKYDPGCLSRILILPTRIPDPRVTEKETGSGNIGFIIPFSLDQDRLAEGLQAVGWFLSPLLKPY
jgi:hypothetical protein